jgi:RNA polymerase sigma-70 factor (ECF subfamily)
MTSASIDDAALVESARAGDREAFERLMRAHLDAVYGHAWLYRVTRNVCLDTFRRGKRQASPVDPLELPDTPSGEFADATATSIDLERSVAALAPEDRDAFNAVTLFGLSYLDAASVLGVPAGTVKSRVFRARRTIIARLGLDTAGGA